MERELSERALSERLGEIESQLDELAGVAAAQGLAIRISCPTGEVVPSFRHPNFPKLAPALRLVRYELRATR